MSTAWFKPKVAPRLIKSFPCRRKKRIFEKDAEDVIVSSVEVWNTTCIVTNFGRSQEQQSPAISQSILVNPSNPGLLGVRKFPYFPRGGPVPKQHPEKYEHHIMGYVRRWGGMEVGKGMLFPFNVVDGLVHEMGGWKLAMHCFMLRSQNGEGEKCPVGRAVITPPGSSNLQREYDSIVHTVPPFYEYDCHPEEALTRCYHNSLKLCQEAAGEIAESESVRFAFPLLGAGGRGFPPDKAIDIAARQSIIWRNNAYNQSDPNARLPSMVLAFGIPNMEIATKLADAISELLDVN